MLKLIIFLFILTPLLFSDTNIVIDKKSIYDDFKIFYLKDIDSRLDINKISEKKFTFKSSNSFTLGYMKGSLWLKFDVENKTQRENFVLTLNESFYEVANLYYYDNKWIKKSNGIFKDIQDREIKTNHLSYELSIKENEKRTFYVELKGKYAYFGNLELYEKSDYYFHNTIGINTIYIFVFGIIFIIILFNLFLYIKAKEKIYLYYVGYSFFNLLYVINISGYLVYVGLQKYLYELQFSASLMIGFLVLFSYEYLETNIYLPKINRLFKSLAIPFFILAVLVVISYQPWNKFINNLAGLVCIFLILISTIIYFKGHNKTKYYIFAMLMYFVFVVFFTFMVNGTIDYSNFSRYGFLIATIVEVMIFSLMLANRYNDIKENIQHYLELEVAQRTDKLKILVQERELLLKEVYHRVKNNFHVIVSMLWFESQKENVNVENYKELINRIKSMSMIHEYLYNSQDLTNINIKEYLDKIIHNIGSSYKKVLITSEIEEMSIEFDNAVSLGIILNETITNAIKHNKNTDSFYIKIKLMQKQNTRYLSIEDNGSGFNLNTQIKGLGLKLIEQFCEKLPKSLYEYSSTNGTKFELQFKEGSKQ